MKVTDLVCEGSKLHSKLARGVSRCVQFLYFSLRQKLRVLPENRKKIFFILNDDKLYRADDGMGRYAYMTLNAFSQAGYNVYFYKKVNLLGFVKLGSYGRFIYYIKNLKFVSKIPADTEEIVYAFDTVYPNLLEKKWKKLIYVNILKPTACLVGEKIWTPYYLHPQMYRLEQLHKIKPLRKKKRTLKAFFGGNASDTYYTNPNVHKYGQMTRREGINTVLELNNCVKRVEDREGFLNMLKSSEYRNECWILETNRCGNTKHTEWFDIMAASDFFICFSGTDLPMCHNSIESMALGAIPILSYPDWFFPPLEHKKNAIIYSGKEDLKTKLQEVLMMDEKDIQQMRRHVTTYYDQYLSNDSFMRNLRMDKGKVCTIMLHPRLISKPNEDEQVKGLLKDLEKIFLKINQNELTETLEEIVGSNS